MYRKYTFFLERLMNKKYPAVKMPDILMSKLYFKAITSVAF
ncbi:hypothetical protein BACEGG_03352 [Bacteroides eggerthii DSM 20697]|nr:hypothetical protein BACEGG_03352 [Bacteroides eggerthii DSM 20697]